MRSRIVSVFSDALANTKIPVLDVATRYAELGQALLPAINPALAERYGVELTSFVVENVSVPPEVEQAIDKAASMTAIGNLNDYVKYQMAQGLKRARSAPVASARKWRSACRWRSRCSSRQARPADRPTPLPRSRC